MPNRGEESGPRTAIDAKADEDESDELPVGDDEDTLVGDDLLDRTEIAGEAEELAIPTKVEGADLFRPPSEDDDDDNEFDVPTRVEGNRRSKPPSGENEFDPSTIVDRDPG